MVFAIIGPLEKYHLINGLIPIFAAPCGDVNSDMVINIIDALMIARFSVGLNPPNFNQGAADVDGNNLINIIDALLIAQYSVGLSTELPGCAPPPITYDILVAAEGSGDYKKVQDAVNAASSGDVILIKPGTYVEAVKIKKNNITFMGESNENTIITNDNDFDDGSEHACFYITGNDITVVNITLENTADSRLGRKQANALYVSGDRTLFYKTKILGFQDTYRHSGGKRSYHKDCVIQGTTDFIYGDGIALFENCVIYNRKDSHVTAHAPGSKRAFGYVFKDCDIRKHPAEVVTAASLGRPWGENANVVYLNCALGGHIRTDGWMVWNGRDTYKTAYYAEYKSTGPGANPELRLSWTHQLTDSEAARYTLKNILTDWDPELIIASMQ